MSELVSTVTGVIVGWGLSCLTQAFNYDALARQTCSGLLIELNERLQSLAKQLQISTRMPADDHRALIEIEKCLNKLRVAIFGLRIQNQILKASISSSFKSFLRYHTKSGGVRREPHHIAVDLCMDWGFGLHPFVPSEKLFALQEFMQLPIYKRAWIGLKTYYPSNKK
jgi:hypothetical protein